MSSGRQTQELEQALLAPPPARASARFTSVQQHGWAHGAKIFVGVNSIRMSCGTPGCVLSHWHVVLNETDEEALHVVIAHLAHLPEPAQRLKCASGQRLLYREDDHSMQANADHELMGPDIEVRSGVVLFSASGDTRTTRSA